MAKENYTTAAANAGMDAKSVIATLNSHFSWKYGVDLPGLDLTDGFDASEYGVAGTPKRGGDNPAYTGLIRAIRETLKVGVYTDAITRQIVFFKEDMPMLANMGLRAASETLRPNCISSSVNRIRLSRE